MRNQQLIGSDGEYGWSKDVTEFQCQALESVAATEDIQKCDDPRGPTEEEQAAYPGLIEKTSTNRFFYNGETPSYI